MNNYSDRFSLAVVSLFILILTNSQVSVAESPEWDIAEPTVFAEGFVFPEGPALARDGDLYVVDYKTTIVSKISPEGKVATVIDTGFNNNGALFDRDGNLFITSWQGGRVFKLDTKGTLTVVSDSVDGKALNGPNDMAWGKEGRLYYTDPHGSDDIKPFGTVNYIDKEGKTHKFADGLAYPNGLTFDKDKTHLYVGDNRRNRILRYLVNPDGTSGGFDVFHYLGDGVDPDGMKMDVEGNLWAVLWTEGEFCCISPAGKRICTIPIPAETPHPTNIFFCGPDMRTAYITATNQTMGKVYKYRLPIAGLPVIPK